MKAENRGNEGFLQRESVEHQGYAEARSTDRSEGKERDLSLIHISIGDKMHAECRIIPDRALFLYANTAARSISLSLIHISQ